MSTTSPSVCPPGLFAALRRRPRAAGAASAGTVSLLAAALVFAPPSAARQGGTALVREGALTQTLVERGTVSSARLLLYGSSISGVQAKIAEIVPEGRSVAPGDVLIRFDATAFEQNLARESAALGQAEAERLRAREELRIERLRADGETAQARQQIGYAESEVANQTDGKGRVAVAEAETAESDAEREVAHAQATVDDMTPMLARGFVTRAELDRAEQALRRARDVSKLATLRRDAVVGFERPAAAARSRAELDTARQALGRQGEAAQARLVEHEAAIRIAASRVDEINARMALLREQVARSVVRSDASGLVVYREIFFGNDKRKPQVGDEVWPNQPIIALPDFSHLTIETRVREIDLHHVHQGGAVSVTLPAYPGLEIAGTVALVGALAEQDPSRPGSKFFPLTVSLNVPSSDPRLRTGMTAQVEIHVATIEHAALVPVQAIFDVAGRPTVFVAGHGDAAPRGVTIAAEDDHDAAVSSGVSAGDTVLLSDPRATRGAR
jgi:HlyD family secretion protein